MEKNFKPFDLEAAKAGAPVVTRLGIPARIVCFDFRKNEKDMIIALVKGLCENEEAYLYSEGGKPAEMRLSKSELDLFMAPVKRTGWVNIYRNGDGVLTGETVHATQEDAITVGRAEDTYIAAVSVEWEE